MILPRQKEEVKPKCIAPILGATIPIHEIQVLVFSKIKKKTLHGTHNLDDGAVMMKARSNLRYKLKKFSGHQHSSVSLQQIYQCLLSKKIIWPFLFSRLYVKDNK
jgi:hypothetical protein